MITIDIKGLRELQAKFSQMPVNVVKQVRGIVENGAKVFVRNAKRDAPRDNGFLSQSISYRPIPSGQNQSAFEIVSGARYSPYMEWGTITRVRVPEDLKAYAITFKGRGIKKSGGIFPRPYFFKQRAIVKSQVEAQIAGMKL